MKTNQNQNTINLEAEVQLDYIPSFQTSTFTVIGDAENILPLADEIKALEAVQATPVPRTNKVATIAVKAVTEAPETLTGRRASLTAKLYDLVNGSSMYDLLQQKRRDERDMEMAQKLGLITTSRCAKHERQLATVRGLTRSAKA